MPIFLIIIQTLSNHHHLSISKQSILIKIPLWKNNHHNNNVFFEVSLKQCIQKSYALHKFCAYSFFAAQNKPINKGNLRLHFLPKTSSFFVVYVLCFDWAQVLIAKRLGRIAFVCQFYAFLESGKIRNNLKDDKFSISLFVLNPSTELVLWAILFY